MVENGGYDDRYTLDPDAHRGVTKFFTGLFYLAADIFTLALTELIFTPVEIAAKDKLKVYHLTYDNDGKLSHNGEDVVLNQQVILMIRSNTTEIESLLTEFPFALLPS